MTSEDKATTTEKELTPESIPQQPQSQRSVSDQLASLARWSNRLGFYDASDFCLASIVNLKRAAAAGAAQERAVILGEAEKFQERMEKNRGIAVANSFLQWLRERT